MLLGCAAALGAGTAAADTLISNLGQSGSTTSGLSTWDQAQAFTTGGNSTGYTLTGVKLRFATFSGSLRTPSASDTVTAIVTSGLTSTATTLATLTNPGTWSETSTLTAPSGTTLAANTTYYVIVEGTGGVLERANNNNEDSGGANGWSIANDVNRRSQGDGTGLVGGTWITNNTPLKIAVEGSVTVNPTDADLTALTVSGTTLSPTFAKNTTSYQATVANSASQVTITPTKSASAATIEYLDGSDNTLTDAVSGTSGFQVNLPSVGEHTVKVKVTAPNGTTTKTYSVDIVRVGPLTACSAASMDHQVWTATMTVGSRTTSGLLLLGWNQNAALVGSDLTDNDFTFAGDTYEISDVTTFGGVLNLSFSTSRGGRYRDTSNTRQARISYWNQLIRPG